MAQHYSNPKRESEPGALPDIETFYVGMLADRGMCPGCIAYLIGDSGSEGSLSNHDEYHVGWYWQSCFPGCIPDGEPSGPFDTEAEALADACEGVDDDEDEPVFYVALQRGEGAEEIETLFSEEISAADLELIANALATKHMAVPRSRELTEFFRDAALRLAKEGGE